VPAVAETYRGTAERFIVMPTHLDGGPVARVADRFFVVEPDRHGASPEKSAALSVRIGVLPLVARAAVRTFL